MFENLDRSDLEHAVKRVCTALYGCLPTEVKVSPTEERHLIEAMCRHIETMVEKTEEDMKRYRQQSDRELRVKKTLKMLCEDLGFSVNDDDGVVEPAEMVLEERANRYIPEQQTTKAEVTLLRSLKQFIREYNNG